MMGDTETDARLGEDETLVPFRLRQDIRITASKNLSTGASLYYFKLIRTGEVYEFGEEEYFICQCLNEPTSLRIISERFEDHFGLTLTEKQLRHFLGELREMGLLVSNSGEFQRRPPHPNRNTAWVDDMVRTQRQASRYTTQPGATIPEPQPVSRNPFRWPLFNPERLLSGLAWLFRPLRIFVWLLIPAVLLAGLTLFHNAIIFGNDFVASWGSFVIIPRLLMALFVVHLLSAIVQGVVASACGARMQEFGILFAFGFLPRFYIDPTPIRALSRRGRLWSYGAPILTRLALFSAGTFLWISYRGSATWWPDFALLLSQMSLLIFFITTIPLFRNDGYAWITELIGEPLLSEHAWKLVGMRLRGKPAPQAMSSVKTWALVLFALGSLIFVGFLTIPITLFAATQLESRFAGTGVIIFLALFCLALLWLVVTIRAAKHSRRKAPISEANQTALVPYGRETSSFTPFSTASAPTLQEYPIYERKNKRSRLVPRLLWLAVIGGLLYIAFLPYDYEIGGSFKILPSSRLDVPARADGEIIKVHVREGEWVKKGDVLAEMSSWDEERDLAVTKAALDQALAKLQRLEEGPKPEEIELAQKAVASAEARVTFSKREAERATILVREGHMSRQNADSALGEYERFKADLAVAQANLDLVKSGATQSEIEALRAEARGLQQQLAFNEDQLERTKIRAPKTARVITPNLHFFVGKYLAIGDLFAELEDNRVVQVEVEVPESDISEVEIGDQVRLKAWGSSDRQRVGDVIGIAPVAETREFAEVVRVKTEVSNEDGFLRTGMTGYAKIDGSQMPVWEAYSRMFIRFFRVEFWSWIP